MSKSSLISFPKKSLQMRVRDYECDLQGIVNNGVYFNYFEHARHCYLHEIGVDFAGLSKQGINLVVLRSEMDYKLSLQPDDIFRVDTQLVPQSRVKVNCEQSIFLLKSKYQEIPEGGSVLVNQAIITCLGLKGNRPMRLEDIFDNKT